MGTQAPIRLAAAMSVRGMPRGAGKGMVPCITMMIPMIIGFLALTTFVIGAPLSNQAHSASTCSELGWTVSHRAQIIGVCAIALSPCSQHEALTHAEARTACRAAGGRLCTAFELDNDCTLGRGCRLDRSCESCPLLAPILSMTSVPSPMSQPVRPIQDMIGALHIGGLSLHFACFNAYLLNSHKRYGYTLQSSGAPTLAPRMMAVQGNSRSPGHRSLPPAT